jgi:O-antigen/teichoic acid export membrane protein
LLTPDLIGLLGYSAYAGAGPLVMLLAPAFLMLQLYVFAPGFAVRERTGLQLAVSLLGAIAAVVLNYVLIAKLGLAGAALATLLSSAIFIGAWFVLSQRLYPLPVRWGRLALFTLAAAGCAAAGMALAGDGRIGDVVIKLGLVALLAAAALAIGLVRLKAIAGLLGGSRAAPGAAA